MAQAERAAPRRLRRWQGATAALALLALPSLVLARAERAAAESSGLPTLEQRVTALESRVAALATALATETAARMAADTALQNNIDAEAAARAAAIGAEMAARVAADTSLQDQIDPLAFVLAPFSREGNDVFITGANLNVRNGMDSTKTTNGLGNLIVG